MTSLLAALTPGFVTVGFGLLFLSWIRPEQQPARVIATALSFLLLAVYFIWRATSTLPPAGWTLDFAVGAVFFAAESLTMLGTAVNLFFLSRTRNRSPDVDANKSWFASVEPPLVDVFICTYNEEEPILERTMVGATGLRYPNYRVWVLDDGRRPWLRSLAGKLGCHYLARPDNKGAKAGNINHALQHVSRLPSPPDFISILDADFVPMPDFLERTLPLFRDDSIGVVQTPQHFINADPIQTNLSATQVWPDEQRLFFDVLMASKDAWDTAFCCGTSSVIRFAPLMRIGGFPTDSVTEDYLVTLRMKEIGVRTAYLNERLTIGLAPEGIKEYITQRGRWCLGFMQIVRGRSGPLSLRSRLTFLDRLSLVDAFLHWTTSYSTKLLGLIVPSLFLLFGIRAVDADLAVLLNYFLPFFLWHSLTMSWLSHGRAMPVMSDAAQFVAAPAVLKAIATGLLRPQGHKFQVTAKGGERGRRFIEWPLLRFYGAALAINLAGIVNAFIVSPSGETFAYGGLALAWSWYNAIILTLVCFICIEQPRHRKAERFAADEPAQISFKGTSNIYRLVDISITGARLKGSIDAPLGARIKCTLRAHTVEATIVRFVADGFAVRFDEEMASRVSMIRNFYASDYVAEFDRVAASRVGNAVLSRIFR